ncbi:restriction endonuclease subunit S [Lactiplantibacillus plantarum]|uniref:restriction endonuclease subunit S n=1 Tax=Lactiplantibacillus plantarum TaxID=1590 RepID=UPI001E2D0289|nr:restriction endonuclease subunit S [Lactiplantibacillus plantarum]MCC6120934.1 restriction endonuclease subunit S [Lactiplantibacillus plantarum]MCW6137417.1 restriction endonuclease subunit S [Lactiplantibacillus plantarum]
MEGKRGSECLLKSVSNIDFNPAYYMDEKFTCSHDVNPLYKKDGEFNYYTGMFISTVIMNDRYRWGYGRKWRPKRMNKSKIKLPIVMENGAPILDQTEKYSDQGFIPDWEFMETYIKKLNYKKPKTSNSLNEIKDLNVSKWEKFRLSDLFNTQMGNGIDAGSVSNDEPRYNYVSRNRNNNGVVNFVDKIDGKKPFEAGNLSLALGGSYLGSCFVQNKRFYTGQNVGILTPKLEMSLCTKQFIATIIRYECRYKYQAFGRELNAHFKKDFYLKLPILKDKHNNTVIDNNKRFSSRGFIPDWEFMETYIKSLPNGDLI